MSDDNEELAALVKTWRGDLSAREAAQILGLPKSTLDFVEQGRGFRYPELLKRALAASPARGKGR